MHLELYRKDRPTSTTLPNLPVHQLCYVFKPRTFPKPREVKGAKKPTRSSQVKEKRKEKRKPSPHSGSQDACDASGNLTEHQRPLFRRSEEKKKKEKVKSDEEKKP